MFIDDPRASQRAYVDSDGKLTVNSVVYEVDRYDNQFKGEVYSAGTAVTPTGALDCFFYIKNNDEKDMVFTGISIDCASDERVYVYIGQTGTPVGGTDLTLVNRNAGSGNTADVTCQYGADITGLSGGGAVGNLFLNGGDSTRVYTIKSDIIVPKNQTLTLLAATGAILINFGTTISFNTIES